MIELTETEFAELKRRAEWHAWTCRGSAEKPTILWDTEYWIAVLAVETYSHLKDDGK